jgi:hypothetical protein
MIPRRRPSKGAGRGDGREQALLPTMNHVGMPDIQTLMGRYAGTPAQTGER